MRSVSDLQILVETVLEKRPLVLLAGQRFLSTGKHPDPVIQSAVERFQLEIPLNQTASLSSLLNKTQLDDKFYEWIAARYQMQIEPDWFENIAQLPWNAVFTSHISPTLPSFFRTGIRDVESVLCNSHSLISPRQKNNLHLTYLYGVAGELADNEKPPSSIQQYYQRRVSNASPLLSRLYDTTTSIGTLIIDGVSLEDDWLDPEDLYGVLAKFKPGQVLWFGWSSSENKNSSLLQMLSEPNGPITFIPERLSSAVSTLKELGQLPLKDVAHTLLPSCVTIKDRTLDVDPSVRLKTSTGASIIEDSWLAAPEPLASDLNFAEFRKFHGHSEGSLNIIEGIQRGFSIDRQFDDELLHIVKSALSDPTKNKEPILLHGQSGSGKSISLAKLAYNIRKEYEFPVLLSSRAKRVPSVEELDDFCLLSENVGAACTLIVCDANAPMKWYQDLVRGFYSRGRKVIVVGSTYRIKIESDSRQKLVEADAELNELERTILVTLLKEYTDQDYKISDTSYLLPTIYRLLPTSRYQLAQGLGKEAHVMESTLRTKGHQKRTSSIKSNNAFAQAFIDAGYKSPPIELLAKRLNEFMGVVSDGASKIVDCVMMAGKLDVAVPISLLMRLVEGSDNKTDISCLFSEIDLFRWSSNEYDDVFIHPRLQVEAELITARRLGSTAAEAAIVVELIQAANPTSVSNSNSEKRFLLDLINRLGVDGLFNTRYQEWYYDIALALTDMRNQRRFADPSLMLQEATLRRRAIKAPSAVDQLDTSEILDDARQIIDLALAQFGDSSSPGLKRACANLRVERAAIYGFRAVQQIEEPMAEHEIWGFYEAARASAKSARNVADTYHAIDVSLWVPHDLLKKRTWELTHHAELVADILDSLEQVDDTQLDSVQRQQYLERQHKLSLVLEDKKLEEHALEQLDLMNSPAGFYLRAHKLGGSLRNKEEKQQDIDRAGKVIPFLESNWEDIKFDSRSLRYLLRAHWLVATRSYLFDKEKSAIPNDAQDLQSISNILEHLQSIEGDNGDNRFKYLQAVIRWRSNRENLAIEIWRDLSRDTAFSDPRRIIKHHLWTGSDGKPKLFYGKITQNDRNNSGKARVQVEGTRQQIDIFQKDFPEQEFRRGAQIRGGFYIAFNFIGPVAEPVRRRGVR
ncbi:MULTISPECIES: hypothetical protein [unclassified Pseudoalteromonas]|uniref:hypothetical protein n=1 Tax=unclassified Pseudoalteromonas TaxID=194690 RepID=UPI0020973095|nr:hypothetical protein [Pseudoalteromonas sp. XMcav2-N]MCO7188112.1 hypothetical protein [Pseudoalteromonas sp. XMcav2-N]